MERSWGEMRPVLPMLILALALVGLADSTYLSLAHFGVVDLHSSSIPNVCRIGAGGCDEALTSQQATVFGIPTALLGAGYFAALVGAALVRNLSGKWPRPLALAVLLAGGMGFSAYLLHSLFFVLDAPCPYCVAAHAVNFAALALCVVSFGRDGLVVSAGHSFKAFTRGHAPHRWRTQP